MAKVVGTKTDAEGYVWSVKLLVGKTWNDGKRILERLIHKVVLLKYSEIRLPDEDAKGQDRLTSWEEPVVIDIM